MLLTKYYYEYENREEEMGEVEPDSDEKSVQKI